MAQNKTVLQPSNKNFFVFTLLLIAILGVSWGAFIGVSAGTLYLSIFLSSIGILVLTQLFVDSNDRKIMKELFKSPFLQSPLLASTMWLFGFIAVILINVIGRGINQGFSTLQFFSPLYLSAGGLGGGISQSFSASAVENSEFMSWFYGVFVAGTIEEFAWAFTLPLAFWIVAIFLNQSVFNNRFGRNFYFMFSLTFSVLTFIGIHALNETYVGIMFIIAGIFRLLMNLSAYSLRLGIAFIIGVHQSNNNLAYIYQVGMAQYIEMLFTNIYGIGLVLLFVAIVVYVFSNLGEITQEWRRERGGRGE